MARQYPVWSQGMQKRLVTSSLALSRKGKQRHSLTPHSTSTSQVTLPASKMFFGTCSSTCRISSYPISPFPISPCSSSGFSTRGRCILASSLTSSAISMVTCCSVITMASSENDLRAWLVLSPKQMKMQATELTRQVRKPMKKEKLTPLRVQTQGVTKTLAIYPNSGRMKMMPAYLPIQEEAMLPWIMYSISAPMPQMMRPPINISKYQGLSSPPKRETRSWPRESMMAPVMRSLLAMRRQKKPMGTMKRMEMALGSEYKRLNCITLISWISSSGFCIDWVWLSTKLCPNIIKVRSNPNLNLRIQTISPPIIISLPSSPPQYPPIRPLHRALALSTPAVPIPPIELIPSQEEKKAKEMREKIKEKRGKKSGDKAETAFAEESFEKIGSYKIYIDKLIGEGTYGRVYKARHEQTEELFACKVISKNKLQSLKMYREDYAEELQRRFKTESEFHKKLSGYPHIVKLVDTIENNKAYYFIMEFCESDLSKVIRTNGTLSEEVALRYFTQIVEGYKSIYSNNAFHRDLKPENLLVKDDCIKISDFGFVKIFTEMDLDKECRSGKNKLRTMSKVGSIKYMAPDVLNIQNNGLATYSAEKCDIWSMGIIMYKMLFGKEPFNGKDEEQMIKNISEKEIVFPDTAKISPELIKKTNVSSQIKRLIKKMLEKEEESRISFKKLYSKIQDYNTSREQESQQKKAHGLREQGDGKLSREGQAKNKKQQLLIVYNKILIQLYHDSVNYASLRQIGIDNYYEITCKLMTLLHEKRVNYIESDTKSEQQVNDKLKQDISSYHNSFHFAIKNIAKLEKEETLETILLRVYHKVKVYEEFQMLMNEVLIFLINLLLLLSLEISIFQPNFVYVESMHLQKKKKDVILKYWQLTLKKIQKNINGEEEEQEEDKLAVKQQQQTKKKKHRHRARDGSQQRDRPQKSDNLQKPRSKDEKERRKKSKDKSHDKHKSKEKKSKKER